MSRWFLRQAALVAAALVSAGAAQARDHVLVMTISNYPQQPLPGVRHDARNALRMAQRLGYDTAQATVLKDSALSTAGLRQAMGQLAEQVALNDRVFVYYSGHGYSARRDNQCVQTLVAQDGGLVGVAELHSQLEAVKLRTRDVMVVLDACHSGGLADLAVTRSSRPNAVVADIAAPAWRSKLFAARDGEACEDPVNFSATWAAVPPAPGTRAAFPKNNFVFIAAANQREVALDDSERGGLATVSLLDCLDEGVVDLDGSGQISPREWLACAQQRLGKAVPEFNAKRGTRWTPHTLEAHGNLDKALSGLAARPPAVDVAGAGAASAGVVAGAMPAPATSALADRTLLAFKQLAASTNGNWVAGFEMPARVRMGEAAAVRYHSAQSGYLSILYLGSDRQHIDMLARNVLLQATSGLTLGELPIKDCPGGCPGDNTFLFMLSQQQLDTDALLSAAQQGGLPLSLQALASLHCAAGASNPGCQVQQRNAGKLKLAIGAAIQGRVAQVLTVTGF